MRTSTVALAGALLFAAAPTAAASTAVSDPLAEVDAVDDDADDGDKGLWGLLGLLGLFAPLFTRRRNDDVTVHRTTTSGRNDGNPLT